MSAGGQAAASHGCSLSITAKTLRHTLRNVAQHLNISTWLRVAILETVAPNAGAYVGLFVVCSYLPQLVDDVPPRSCRQRTHSTILSNDCLSILCTHRS